MYFYELHRNNSHAYVDEHTPCLPLLFTIAEVQYLS